MAIMAKKTNNARVAILIVGILFAACLVIGLLCLEVRRELIGRTPSQPVSGYTGDWKMHGIHGEQERPLPPAVEIWRYHESWKLTNEWASRFYIARFGHAERQLNFESYTNQGGSLGDRECTRVKFLYNDPTNGTYALSWSLPGRHDVNFLKLDDTEKWFQLQLLGTPGTQPPQLEILGIEGFVPFHN